jgi:nuclear pore complex protein Nup107
MTHIKDLLEAIEVVFHVLISTITANTHDHTQTDPENSYKVLCAYIPEIVLAYLAVLQVFVDTKRMRELVDALAQISKFMLRLGEFEPKKSGLVKKRGSKGETLRIWDLNARERV